jgi:hypothetical protein
VRGWPARGLHTRTKDGRWKGAVEKDSGEKGGPCACSYIRSGEDETFMARSKESPEQAKHDDRFWKMGES